MFEGATGRITEYMSINRFGDILRNLPYTDKNVPAYSDKFFHMSHMEDAWNADMTKVFELFWVSVLDKSMQEWIGKYTYPDWICAGCKIRPFGNERHTIACKLLTII